MEQHRFFARTAIVHAIHRFQSGSQGQEQGKDMPGEKDETCGTRMAIEETGIKQVGFEEVGAFAAESISYTRPTSIYHFANERRNT